MLLLSVLNVYNDNIHTLLYIIYWTYRGLRITVRPIINKKNCELLYHHCFPDVIDRNILNVITLHVHCIYAGLK